MGRLQERAKPFLIPLFNGEFTDLTDIAQIRIAAWCAMATMTSEHLARNPQKIVVTQEERAWLMQHGRAPDTWRIWIGKFKRNKWPGQWIRITLPVIAEKDIPQVLSTDFRAPNVQTTTFIIGELYVHAMSSAFQSITDGWDWRSAPKARNSLNQIWPILSGSVPFGLLEFSDTDAESFATAYYRWHDRRAQIEVTISSSARCLGSAPAPLSGASSATPSG
jgi:hypothetical protein